MRLLIQRVKKASVEVNQEVIGAIDRGLLVFLGIHKDDQPKQTEWMISKTIHLRIFEDEQGKMNKSLMDIQGQILVISQFTLYGNCQAGRRPDFLEAAPPQIAEPIYEKFIRELKISVPSVQSGKFRAHMEISLINDGPVTLMIEDRN